MSLTSRVFALVDRISPPAVASAHCDLPCGVYDPAQARVEAESVKAIQEKYQDTDDPVFRQRCILIKEERADLVKHHLWVLWTDYFKPEHLESHPELHELFWEATKAAGEAKTSQDPKQGDQLLELIDRIDKIFWDTKHS
jgi:nickel superoxide dismutase